MPLTERVWIACDSCRYRVRPVADSLLFLTVEGRQLGTVPAEGRELASLEAEELEALLLVARRRGPAGVVD